MRRTTSMGLSFPPFTGSEATADRNGVVFLVFWLLRAFDPTRSSGLGLLPPRTGRLRVVHGEIWQLITYSFLHYGILHLLFNMLALWMFGAQLEVDWATTCSCSFISSA